MAYSFFTEESTCNCFGFDGRTYVKRSVGEEHNKKCIKSTGKGKGVLVMVWAGMTINGSSQICCIHGTMNQHVYVDILNKYFISFTNEKLSEDWVLQDDYNPKHTSRKTKLFLEQHKLNVTQWPVQSHNLNPMEYLWHYVKSEVHLRKPSFFTRLYKLIEEI